MYGTIKYMANGTAQSGKADVDPKADAVMV